VCKICNFPHLQHVVRTVTIMV